MIKKNILGIVVVVLIAAAFAGGYLVGRGAAPQMSSAQRMAGGQRPPGAGGKPAGNPGQPATAQRPSEPQADAQTEKADQSPQSAKEPEAEPRQRPATPDSGTPGGRAPGDGGMTDEMRAVLAKAREEGKSREEIQAMIAKLREDGAADQADTAKPAQSATGAQRPAAQPTPDANAIEFYGTAAPSAEVNVQSNQGGTILVLNGKEGDTVKKGALLVQFDESEQRLNLDKAQSSRNTAQQQVQQAESNLKSARTNLKRNQELFQDGLISQQQIDDFESKVETAQSSVNNARENVKQADTQITLLQNALDNFVVRAPISGVIDKKNYNLQEIYRANDVLYHIVNIDEVYVNVDVPETYIKRIREGMSVTVTFNALGEQIFSGILETVLPSGTTSNRTFTVKVRVKNPDQSIKPGMFASVVMVLSD